MSYVHQIQGPKLHAKYYLISDNKGKLWIGWFHKLKRIAKTVGRELNRKKAPFRLSNWFVKPQKSYRH